MHALTTLDDAGYTTQAVIITALLVVLAIAAGAILWTHVISKAIHTRHGCTGLVEVCRLGPGSRSRLLAASRPWRPRVNEAL
jgi:hypothetical protein